MILPSLVAVFLLQDLKYFGELFMAQVLEIAFLVTFGYMMMLLLADSLQLLK